MVRLEKFVIHTTKYNDFINITDRVEELVGHAPGGVCPFGAREDVPVYLDESLRKYERVYPAAGDDHSAVELTVPELEGALTVAGWVDVTKEG